MKVLFVWAEINYQVSFDIGMAVATLTAAWLVYTYNRKQLKHETKERTEQVKQERLLNAGMGFWGLLRYTTEVENNYSVLVWQRPKGSGAATWYLQPANARQFMEQLNEVNYVQGHGLFLNNSARALFYEYRNILYGMLLQEKDNAEPRIEIKNNEMAERMQAIHKQLIERLRAATGLENPVLQE